MMIKRLKAAFLAVFWSPLLVACAPDQRTEDAARAKDPAAWPTEDGMPVNQWYMNTQDDDGTLRHYIAEYGSEASPAKTVIVLHGGWGADHSYLIPVIQPLAREFRFVLYDQRGSLRTPVSAPSEISFDALVEDLEQLRQRLQLEKVTLLAHSMGAHLAYGYLRAHPARVEKLILAGPVPPSRFGEHNPTLLKEVWPDRSAAESDAVASRLKIFEVQYARRALRTAAEAGLLPASIAETARRQDGDEVAKLYAETDKAFQTGGNKTDQQKTHWWRITFTCINVIDCRSWRQMRGGQIYYNPAVAGAVLSGADFGTAVKDFWPTLKSFKGPVHVIIGAHDYTDLGPTLWPKLITRLPAGHLNVIPDAGHSAWMDAPDAFNEALRTALAPATSAR